MDLHIKLFLSIALNGWITLYPYWCGARGEPNMSVFPMGPPTASQLLVEQPLLPLNSLGLLF